ncbi:hypothetical protein E2542_SST05719 [Spatholobus suberectus]|nr:hypothetical protein E2542_SST05719 [Spatholobus suberectus]
MYVTRPISMYKRDPGALLEPPLGPNSGPRNQASSFSLGQELDHHIHKTFSSTKSKLSRQALGCNDTLRARLPCFNFPLSNDSSESTVVGKWYCPFMFLKEGMRFKEQMRMSMFYEVTLKQRLEKVFLKENGKNGEDTVLVDVVVKTKVVKVAGKDVVWDENGVVDKVLWFRSFDDDGREVSVGLSLEMVERMKWEQ